MALALYRKYRPRTFAEVIGQEHVTEPLSQALRSGRLHHAYLFSGPRGCGKTSSARILARSLNCEQGPTPDPCGVCASCKSLANDGAGSIDVIEIDAASHGGVDDARDLREKAFFAPASSRYKIYVIDEAHMVSSAGFNALLKLVEEPPDYVKFIFATTEPDKVLATIRSRTHHYPFRLIPPAVLRPYLRQLTDAEGVHVEPAVFPLVVRAGGGSARDTLSVLDQLIAGAGPEGVSYGRAVALLGVTDVALIDEMCDAIAAGDGAAAYATIDRVAEAGHDPRRFASDLLERFRDLIVLQQVPDAVAKGLIDGPADQLDAMGAQATRLGPATLSRCADIVHNGLIEMRGTTAPRLLLELITARMLLPGAEDSTGALLQRLERMERRLTLTGDGQEDARPQHTSPDTSTAAPARGALVPAGGGLSAARAAAAAAGRRTPTDEVAASPDDLVASPGGPTAAGADEFVGAPEQSVSPAPEQPVASPAGTPAQHAPPGSAMASPDARPARATPPTQTPSTPAPAAPAARTTPPVRHAPIAQPDPVRPGPAPSGPAARSGRAPAAEPVPGPAVAAASAEPVPGAPIATASAEPGGGSGAPAPQARRPEPAALLPDAPAEAGVEPVSGGAPGQLTAAAVREVWPEIITAVGRQSKKVAALAAGATVRDLDGQTVVLTFRFPAHAKMVNDQPELIVDALYEALGGRWQIRCELAGEGGGARGGGGASGGGGSGRGRGAAAPAQSTPTRPASDARPARPRESPARPGPQGSASAATSRADDDGDDWPEPARPGGAPSSSAATTGRDGGAVDGHPDVDGPGAGAVIEAEATDGVLDAQSRASGPRAPAADTAAVSGAASAVPPAPAGRETRAAGGGPASGTAAGPAPGAAAGVSTERPVGRAGDPASGGSAGRAGGGGGTPGSGLAAARAAAAAGATRQAGPAAPRSTSWSDGSPTEEAPYDPEFDGRVRGQAAAYEGFDPGDEPLDDLIDERTARQSGEQQAMQLLREAFGAEKISES